MRAVGFVAAEPFLDPVADDDFMGVPTYTRTTSHADGSQGVPAGQPVTTMGYEYRPQALADVCRYVWARTRTPILVTENGFAGEDDARWAAIVREPLRRLQQATAEGVDMRGCLYWSLLDNYEWMSGDGPKFGVVGVDRPTQTRRIKPSALTLGAIARASARPAEEERAAPTPATDDAAPEARLAAATPIGTG